LFTFSLTCTPDESATLVELIPVGEEPAGSLGALYISPDNTHYTPVVNDMTLTCVEETTDTDGDGCVDLAEVGDDETQGGLRDPTDPNDYYDVLGPFGDLTLDGVIDVPNDILGVVLHYSPTGVQPYDPRYDRGPPDGANHWERGPPDGAIDLANDILGVILQFNHNCA
jgi:hypothetical protein